MSNEATEKTFKRGDKRSTAIGIMSKGGADHVYDAIIDEISTTIGVSKGSAKSYYKYIVDQKLIAGFTSKIPPKKKEIERAAAALVPDTEASRKVLSSTVASNPKLTEAEKEANAKTRLGHMQTIANRKKSAKADKLAEALGKAHPEKAPTAEAKVEEKVAEPA